MTGSLTCYINIVYHRGINMILFKFFEQNIVFAFELLLIVIMEYFWFVCGLLLIG